MLDGLTDGRVDGKMKTWIHGQVDRWRKVMDSLIERRMDGWMDGWMDGCVEE